MFTNKTIQANNLVGLFIILAGILNISCASNSDKRPSPLMSDSVIINKTLVTIEYSSPSVKKREIWGGLVPYDELWRTGANKATYLRTSENILVNGEPLEKGSYSLFTIPREDSAWTVIFNRDWDQWGSYNYDVNNDVLRLELIPYPSDFYEMMQFTLSEKDLLFQWEKLAFKINLASANSNEDSLKLQR
jgi:hypothetical protein